MRARIALALWATLCLGGCASVTGYLGRRPLTHGPYYHTWARHTVPESAVVAHLPIEFDIIAANLPPDGVRMLEPLLTAMNGYLDGAGWSTGLDQAPSPPDQAPWAYVGTIQSLARVEAVRHFWTVDVPGGPEGADADMVIQAKRPSKDWSAQLAALAGTAHADYVLRISLGAAEYYPRNRAGLSLRKAVDLGTDNTVAVGWLRSLNEPVAVIHLVGLLLSSDGRVLRAGAEGIVMRQAGFFDRSLVLAGGRVSLSPPEATLTESDVAALLASYHREDLAGQPLAWEVALGNLVRQLLGRQ